MLYNLLGWPGGPQGPLQVTHWQANSLRQASPSRATKQLYRDRSRRHHDDELAGGPSLMRGTGHGPAWVTVTASGSRGSELD